MDNDTSGGVVSEQQHDKTEAEANQDDALVMVRPKQASLPIGAWILIVGALSAICLWGMARFSSLIAPAFLALTLVLTIRPIHRFWVRRGIPPWLSAIGSIIVLVTVLGGIIGLTVLAFLPLPKVVMKYQANYDHLVSQITDFLQNNAVLQRQGYPNSSVEEFIAGLDLESVMGWLKVAFDQVSSFTGMFAIVAMSIFFIVIDTLTLDARSKIVERAQPEFHEALSGFEGRVRQYWLVASIFGAIVAVFDWIALQALGIPLAMAWALISFITNYIPNVGFILGLLPPALFGLLEGGWQLMVWVTVAYSLINFIIQSLLQPKFTADAVGLSATVTFLSLLLWAVVLGPLGALLAVPVTLFFKAILVDSSPSTRWIDAFLTSEADVRRKRDTGKYDIEDAVTEVWTGFQSAVGKAADSIRKPRWKVRSRKPGVKKKARSLRKPTTREE